MVVNHAPQTAVDTTTLNEHIELSSKKELIAEYLSQWNSVKDIKIDSEYSETAIRKAIKKHGLELPSVNGLNPDARTKHLEIQSSKMTFSLSYPADLKCKAEKWLANETGKVVFTNLSRNGQKGAYTYTVFEENDWTCIHPAARDMDLLEAHISQCTSTITNASGVIVQIWKLENAMLTSNSMPLAVHWIQCIYGGYPENHLLALTFKDKGYKLLLENSDEWDSMPVLHFSSIDSSAYISLCSSECVEEAMNNDIA